MANNPTVSNVQPNPTSIKKQMRAAEHTIRWQKLKKFMRNSTISIVLLLTFREFCPEAASKLAPLYQLLDGFVLPIFNWFGGMAVNLLRWFTNLEIVNSILTFLAGLV